VNIYHNFDLKRVYHDMLLHCVNQVNDQEAVDVVLREKNLLVSCKKLVDMSSSRGSMDDITVMVINLQNFVATSC
jgi:protein phosphatase 1L